MVAEAETEMMMPGMSSSSSSSDDKSTVSRISALISISVKNLTVYNIL